MEIDFCRGQQLWQQQREAPSFYGHYAEQYAYSNDECFKACTDDSKCAAACFTVPFQCRLYKFGFDTVAKSTCYSYFIKPEVMLEISNKETVHAYSIVKQGVKLIGQFLNTADVLTPSLCFTACKTNPQCIAASFTIDPMQPVNCLLFQPGPYTASSELNHLWTSYVKTISTRSSKFVLEQTCLIGHYAMRNSVNQNDCFASCDSDPACAAVSFFDYSSLSSSTCLFFQVRIRAAGPDTRLNVVR
jgi:hypothetical protein